MKTSSIFLFSTALIGLIYLTSCSRIHKVEGNGIVTTDNRTVPSFTALRSEGSFDVFISYDNVPSVKVEAESNLQQYIETDVEGSVLVARVREHRRIDNNYPIRIYVKTPYISGIDLSGSGKVDCDSINTPYLNLDLSGSGRMNVIAMSHKIKAKISGSGQIYLSGNASETDFDINGSGDIHSYGLEQDTCFADISGSGDMYVYVIKLLDVRISGSGRVHYMGNPAVNTFISGSGSVIHE